MGTDNDNEWYRINEKLYPCATSITMGYIGGKWKMVILFHLKEQTRRYNELRKLMPVVTERTLSLQLKQLEEDGVVRRVVYTGKPPLRVEYSLTDFGKTLIPVLDALAGWGRLVAKERGEVVRISKG
ncbi:MAG: transcriptional regulator [Flavobacterium sp. BFFFF1]|uniref:winged helix-turn-helix transcriptional regulator n=1 Tax=Flavobacterium sp. BFFFF1 TaxID=2015557 RepID=UPI000BD0FB8C|nr:helix-turn-helix domain-containing protein [Flavobacterium sp. BFFFF1]OYU79218.1 MAG: transcriptional regulator [Flavobacterium sp. BFFFF1]